MEHKKFVFEFNQETIDQWVENQYHNCRIQPFWEVLVVALLLDYESVVIGQLLGSCTHSADLP